jgi:hypothetical protein
MYRVMDALAYFIAQQKARCHFAAGSPSPVAFEI